MITFDAPTIAAIVGIVGLLIIAGSGLYRLGRLGKQVEQQGEAISEVRKEIREVREEMRNEMREMRAELLEEMRRGNQQILVALANHSHDENGHAVFRIPPGAETPAAV